MTIQNSSEMEKHLRKHSYKHVQVQCNFCTYLANNELGIEAHVRKVHEKNFDCCICDHNLKDEESLELHLNTCEIYSCDICKEKFKSLSDLKTHLQDNHKDKILKFKLSHHMKRNRGNSEVYDSRIYSYKDLFEKE